MTDDLFRSAREDDGFDRLSIDVPGCLTVFEHLNQPLKIAELLSEALNPGGVLVFDYTKSAGEGLHTRHAVREREAVLDYIAGHFDLPAGPIAKNASVGLTVARRPQGQGRA